MAGDLSISKCSAIIVAAGSSRRMGFDKLAADLGGMPVLRRTVQIFLQADSVEEIIVVCPEERWKLIEGLEFTKPVKRVNGGETRQESVAAGMAALSAECWLVAVHDGARPLVSPRDIDRCVTEAAEFRAVALARRVTETLKRADKDKFSKEPVAREDLWFMETPQVFRKTLLQEAYTAVKVCGILVTDDVSAVESIGVRVKFVESKRPNLKITTQSDLFLASALLNS